MTGELTFFGIHCATIEKRYPDVTCPVKFAREVLAHIGVAMTGDDFTEFVTDLAIQRKTREDKGEINE